MVTSRGDDSPAEVLHTSPAPGPHKHVVIEAQGFTVYVDARTRIRAELVQDGWVLHLPGMQSRHHIVGHAGFRGAVQTLRAACTTKARSPMPSRDLFTTRVVAQSLGHDDDVWPLFLTPWIHRGIAMRSDVAPLFAQPLARDEVPLTCAAPAFLAMSHLVRDALRYSAARAVFAHLEIAPTMSIAMPLSDRLALASSWRSLLCPGPDGPTSRTTRVPRAVHATIERFAEPLPAGWSSPSSSPSSTAMTHTTLRASHWLSLRHVVLQAPLRDIRQLQLLAELVATRPARRDVEGLLLIAQHAEGDEITACARRVGARFGLVHDDIALHTLAEFLVHDEAVRERAGRRTPRASLTTLVRLLEQPRVADIRIRRARAGACRGQPDTRATARPPIALPDLPGIRFLDDVPAIIREGAAMQHCIGTYADDAVDGRCFLFHVEHRGACASVEVGHDGVVRQANGPRNTDNAAAQYGRTMLSRWAAAFSSHEVTTTRPA